MTRALIIGGGICGLACAHALQKAGIDFLLFEKSSELREVGAGLTLWANGVKAMSRISLEQFAINSGQSSSHFEFISENGKSLGVVDLSQFSARVGFPSVSINRMQLMKTLETNLDLSRVKLAHEFESFTQSEKNATVKFTNGSSFEGDFILACDGLHSKLRHWMHPGSAQKYAGYTCFRGVANVPPGLVPPGAILHYMGTGSQIGLLDVGRGQVCWYVTQNAKPGLQSIGANRKRDVLNAVENYPQTVKDVIEQTEADAILLNDIYDRDPVNKWVSDRVLLMGDAAHPTTPNLGQGACMAIEDAVVLADCFAGSADFHEAFSKFTSLRQKRTSKIVLASRKIGAVSQVENWIARSFRDESVRLSLQFNALSDFTYALTVFD